MGCRCYVGNSVFSQSSLCETMGSVNLVSIIKSLLSTTHRNIKYMRVELETPARKWDAFFPTSRFPVDKVCKSISFAFLLLLGTHRAAGERPGAAAQPCSGTLMHGHVLVSRNSCGALATACLDLLSSML